MGMVHAYKAGHLKHPSAKIKEVAKHISKQDAKDFAMTKHTGLPEHVKEAEFTHYLAGVMRYCVEKSYDAQTTHQLVKQAGAQFFKQATQMSIPGGPDIGDPNQWGVNPGEKPQSPAQQQEQGELNSAQAAVNQQTPPSNVKNQGGIAPMPHRYRWDLDDTVLRIKRDQIAYAQKKSHEAQKVQHTTGVGPTAQGQTGSAQQAAPQLAQQHQQQAQTLQSTIPKA